MSGSLRILILDDQSEERALLEASLREAGGFDIAAPSDSAGFRALLAGPAFDAVLTAARFDTITWADAHREVRAVWPDAALVIIADRADDRIVNEALQGGVDNYLLRTADPKRRVPLVLHSALVWAKQRATSARVMGRLQLLLDQINVGVFRSTLDGHCLEANPALLRILQLPDLTSLQRVNTREFYRNPPDRDLFVGRMTREGQVRDFEFDAQRSDGEPLRLSISATLDRTGREPVIDGLIDDITERRRDREALRRSETELRALFAALPETVIVFNRDGRYIKILTTDPHRLYMPTEERIGRTVHEVWPEMAEFFQLHILRALAMGGSVTTEYRVVMRGEEKWYEAVVSPLGNDQVIWVARDTTERRQSREALRSSEERLRALLAAIPDLVMVFDREGRYVQIAPTNPRLLVRPAEELIGRSLHEVLPAAQADEFLDYIRRALDGVQPVVHGYDLDVRGERIRFQATIARLTADTVIAVARDVTEAYGAEQRLQASEERFRALVQNSRDAIALLDAQGIVLYNSHSTERITGYGPTETIGWSVFEFPDPADLPRAKQLFAEVLAEPGKAKEQVLRIRIKSGELRDFEITAVNRLDDPAIGAIVMNYRDVTKRVEAEREVRESSERLDLALEAASGAVWDWDLQTGHVYWDPRWGRLLGYEPGELSADIDEWDRRIHPDDVPSVRRALAAHVEGRRPVYECEHRLRAKDGTWKWMLDRGKVVSWDAEGRARRLVGTLTDLSDRRRLEEQLAQAQKMEAVGQLAGGIAHDFNNVLTAILGTSELILAELDAGDPHREDLEEIKRSANRAASLTRQLLAFSRRQVLQPRVVDLNAVVTNIDRMLHRLIGENITLELNLARDLGRVRADPGQIEQIIVNLAVNARDAMPGGGRLMIDTLNVRDERGDGDASAEGGYVMLAVRDTGVGMDAQTKTHLFEPFFTTKERGRGTGLGLATVYGIVRQSGGFIRVASELGQGALFRIYLPRVEPAPSDEAETAAAARLSTDRGVGTILFVEDEEPVRKLGQRILEREGYTVLAAEDGDEALRIAEVHPGPIHVLLTDVVMPGMNGVDLARRVEPLRPGLRVMFTSGYPETERGQHGTLERGGAFLQKPFTPEELTRRIREIFAVRG
jgi:PAS domain S-box-containing protein